MPLGPATAFQSNTWYSGQPCSAKVGTSGSVGMRFRPEMPMARTRPLLMNGAPNVALVSIMEMFLPITSVKACDEPLYGTCNICTPIT